MTVKTLNFQWELQLELGGRLMDCLRCGYRRGKRGELQSDRLISYASWLDWLQAENMRPIKTHSIFPCCYPKSFLTADHLMGAVSGRAQVVFLSERLSEVCVCVWMCPAYKRNLNQDTCWVLWFYIIFSMRSPPICRQIWGAQMLQVCTGECLKLRGDHSIAEKLLILILLIHKQQKMNSGLNHL